MGREQVRQERPAHSGYGGVIRGVAREIRRGEQWHQRRVQLSRSQVPVSKLAVLTREKRVVGSHPEQRIGTGSAWRIRSQPIFENPPVDVSIGPRNKARRTLPEECLGIRRKVRSRKCSRKI